MVTYYAVYECDFNSRVSRWFITVGKAARFLDQYKEMCGDIPLRIEASNKERIS